jgi:nucleoside-diphosphate-sugar epimerase
VDDVAEAFAAALHAETAQGAYNVGAPGPVRQSEVASLVGVRGLRLPYRARRAAAGAMTRLRVPGAVHPWFVDFNRYPVVVSSARAEAGFGWRATCDSAGTLRRFAETLSAS